MSRHYPTRVALATALLLTTCGACAKIVARRPISLAQVMFGFLHHPTSITVAHAREAQGFLVDDATSVETSA